MKMDIQSIIERVRKLLALSQSDNANEAAAATAKANALIDQYRISVEQIGESEDPIGVETDPLYQGERVMTWRKMLASRLSEHYGCYHWYTHLKGDRRFGLAGQLKLRVAGRKSDVAVLRYMFAYISSECERLAVKECKGKGRTYAESYRQGFVHGVGVKLAESRKQAVDATPDGSGALVKLDERALAAARYTQNAVKIDKGKAKSLSVGSDPTAFANGQTAGGRLHLGNGLGSGRTRMLGQG
jgi:hypothetical protein